MTSLLSLLEGFPRSLETQCYLCPFSFHGQDEGTDASQTPTTVNTPATVTPVRRFGNFNRLPQATPNLETIFSEASHDDVSMRGSRDMSLRVPVLDPTPESPVLGDVNGGGGYTGYDSESEDMTSTDELSPPDLRQLSNPGGQGKLKIFLIDVSFL